MQKDVEVQIADEYQLISINQVAAMLNASVRHVWRMIANNEFPSPVKVGKKNRRWVLSEVKDYLDSMKQQRMG
jgi:excisionase family DNA binding protein